MATLAPIALETRLSRRIDVVLGRKVPQAVVVACPRRRGRRLGVPARRADARVVEDDQHIAHLLHRALGLFKEPRASAALRFLVIVVAPFVPLE